MRTLHSHLDVNKDGVLSYDDFMLLGDRFAKLGHLTDNQKEEFNVVLRVSVLYIRLSRVFVSCFSLFFGY